MGIKKFICLPLFLTAISIDATSFAPVKLATLSKQASHVIEGKVTQKFKKMDGTFTTELLVKSIYKGKLGFDKIKLTPFDVFDMGQNYVVFLDKDNNMSYKEEFHIVKGGLGYFLVENGIVIVHKQASGLSNVDEGDKYELNQFLIKASLRKVQN